MKRIIFSILCILWIGFIFFNSSQSGTISHNISMKFARELFLTVTHYLNINMSKSDMITRKCAHVFEYMVLAIIVRLFLTVINVKKKNIIFFTLLLVFIIAGFDETLQLFIQGRTSKMLDVFIDLSGGIIGCCISSVIYKVISRFFAKKTYLC